MLEICPLLCQRSHPQRGCHASELAAEPQEKTPGELVHGTAPYGPQTPVKPPPGVQGSSRLLGIVAARCCRGRTRCWNSHMLRAGARCCRIDHNMKAPLSSDLGRALGVHRHPHPFSDKEVPFVRAREQRPHPQKPCLCVSFQEPCVCP